MKPIDFARQSEDYARIEKAIRFIEAHHREQPGLDRIAKSVHLSPYHFDRLFRRWAGISPVRFLRVLTLDYAKKKLAESKSLLETALSSGLSGPGRLHDLFVTCEAVTPGEFKTMAQGLKITYGFGNSPFGLCLIALTKRGICYLGFDKANRQAALKELQDTFPGADLRKETDKVIPVIASVFNLAQASPEKEFNLFLKGTNFQVNVWRALLKIPMGRLVSYQDVATLIGRPESSRAVGSAIALNPVSFLIPCHRVITKSGRIHQYRWGAYRKKAMIGWEDGNPSHSDAKMCIPDLTGTVII